MARSSLLSELVAYARIRKRPLLVVLIALMVAIGTLLVFAQGSLLAPFIYTIF